MPTRPGHKLTDDVREYIVKQFATFLSPQQVADATNERFGLALDRRQVSKYDPEQVSGNNMAKKWRVLHAETRARFLDEIAEIPIAERSARLKQLQIHYDKAVSRGNTPLCLSILKQAAEEAGGILTNERTVHHKGRVTVEREEVSEDEMRAMLSDALAEEWEKLRDGGAGSAPTRH